MAHHPSRKPPRGRGKGEPATSARLIGSANRRERWIKLRLEGLSLTEIARETGVTIAAVHRGILQELRKIPAGAEIVRRIELARCDAVIRAHWKRRGDPERAAVILRAIQLRARIAGVLEVRIEDNRQVNILNVLSDPQVQARAREIALSLAGQKDGDSGDGIPPRR